MRYKLKQDISTKMIREMLSIFMPELEIPLNIQCTAIQNDGKYAMAFSVGDFEYKFSLFTLFGEAFLLSHQRLAGADGRFVPTGFHKVPMEYLAAHGFLKAEVI